MSKGSPKALVIVESPVKARTIRKFLDDSFQVEACMGHVRDLPSSASELPVEIKGQPWARLAVDVQHGFQPVYVIPSQKKKVVTELRRALKSAEVLYIATDEDREGESIGWHLLEVLKPKVPSHRMVFHEITKSAIQKALAQPRQLDMRLIQAQEARRVLDRLVGYTVSPLLWKKVGQGLSAGRVQSVAVRLLVLRERERMSFVSGNWWDLKAQLQKSGLSFDAQLSAIGTQSLATGKDFDERSGNLKEGRKVFLLRQAEAEALRDRLRGLPLKVLSIERKESNRQPYPPFTTSTLQQEANRKLGLSAAQTMKTAQRLYENGHITYMRTDSVNLAEEAVQAIRQGIELRFGPELLSSKPRRFSTRSKGAQEAHEAIRPAGTAMATAEELALSGQEARLYELIWKRSIATQMRAARLASTSLRLGLKDPETGHQISFRASGRQVISPGFFRAYVRGTDDPSGQLDNQSKPLPQLEEGELLSCSSLEALSHETRPQGRYTEATLVKALETQGIGRPSTYASIIETIQQRGYVNATGRQLSPTFTAMAVTRLLEETLPKVVDVDFTASMETWLDSVTTGGNKQAYLDEFYNKELLLSIAAGEQIDARKVCTFEGGNLGECRLRVGRYGPFLEQPEGKPISLPQKIAPADLNSAFIEELRARAERGEVPLGRHPESGEPIFLREGRFGPYIQLGEVSEEQPKPKRQSLLPKMDPETVDLEKALALLALPRLLGLHPESGEEIRAGLGRYGPFVQHKKEYASLKREDDLFSVDLERALEILAEKASRGQKSEPLRLLGEHPEDGEPIAVLEGRYGPYVKHLRVNASLPKGVTVEEISLEQALELLEARRSRIQKKAGAKKKASAKKKKPATRKKASAKKKKPATRKKSSAKKKHPPTRKNSSSKKKPPSRKKSSAKKKPPTRKKSSVKKKPATRKKASSTA